MHHRIRQAIADCEAKDNHWLNARGKFGLVGPMAAPNTNMAIKG